MKIYARQANPEFCDTSLYFDFAEEARQGYLTVIGLPRYTMTVKSPEWEKLEDSLPEILDALDDLKINPKGAVYRNMTELFRDYGFECPNTRRVHEIKEAVEAWSEKYQFEEEIACTLMTLYTGEKWYYSPIRGCSQGDYAEVYFCDNIPDETKRKKYIDELEAYYFGTGVEVEVHDGDEEPETVEDISGYWEYIPVPYADADDVKAWLAEYAGDAETKPEDVTLFIPTTSHTVWDYEIA